MWAQWEELGRGKKRLMWLGGIRRPAVAASLWEVEVTFIEEPRPLRRRARWESFWRPIEELPLFGVNSLWINGRCVGYPSPQAPMTLHVIGRSGRYVATDNEAGQPFGDAEYSLFGKKHTAGCMVFDTLEGTELVVPGWQILQAFYLFDRNIVSAVVSGMLDASKDYGTEVPWLPGTGLRDGCVTYHLPSWMREPVAKAFARLLFEPLAHQRAMEFHKWLMATRASAAALGTDFEFKRLPVIRPPHDDVAAWTFRGTRIRPRGKRERVLLFHLMKADIPYPFSFQVIRKSTAAPLPPDVQDLPPITRREPVPPRDGSTLPLAAC